MKVLLIIPAYNEEDSIETVVDNIIENYPQYDYIVINDGATDNTKKICDEKGYNYLDLPVNLGLSRGIQVGMKYAYQYKYDIAVQIDSDGQHRVEYISEMLKMMEEQNADIVIGSRFVEKEKKIEMRHIGGSIISFLILLTTGVVLKDPTSGMRAFSRDIIYSYATLMNFTPEPDTISYLIKKGKKVFEVQVEMNERLSGESYLNLKNSVLYMIHMCTSILFIQWYRKKG